MRCAMMIKPQRLKRIFGINSETFSACGGPVRIIARIKTHDVIKKIHTQWPAHQQKYARERVIGVDSRADMPA